MDLKNVLGQINSDRRNLDHGWLPPLAIFDDTILALQVPSRDHPPHHFTPKILTVKIFATEP